jgi:hypothetical protein
MNFEYFLKLLLTKPQGKSKMIENKKFQLSAAIVFFCKSVYASFGKSSGINSKKLNVK